MKRSVFSQAFELRHGDRALGALERRAWYSRKILIDLLEDWPFEHRIFVLWLTLLLWRRAGAGAG